jgi:pimeloyl-ACP methyl ester carboxylesterase
MPRARVLCRHVLALLALAAMTGCTWARPTTYPIEPGLSASFTPSERVASEAYAEMFCSVLEGEFSANWASCDTYVKMSSPHQPRPLDAMPAGWTILRIGGFGAQCVAATAEAFADAGKHLETHGLTQYHVPVGAFDTSEQNAERIRDFVVKLGSGHRFIVVAHSKGAADTMVALTSYPNELKDVAALITVAGAVGGSHLVDRLDKLNQDLIGKLGLPSCVVPGKSTGPNAIDSMRRENRQKFLADHERLKVSAFSISAVSTKDNTSKILQGLWDHVAPFAQEQDSHIVEREAIVPGGQFLGRALGDHWAVAFPFDPNPKVSAGALRVIDKNRFPREALIEAAVRVAVQSLK